MAAGDTQITVVGNLVADPELRFTPAGQPVATFRIASTPRFRDNASGEWKDGDSLFLTCNVWRQAAENVAESLQRGMRVIVSGSAQAAELRDQGRREADRLRGRGRRCRPVSAERVREGQPGQPQRRWPAAPGRGVQRAGGLVRRRQPGGRRPVGLRLGRGRLLRRTTLLISTSTRSATEPTIPADAGLC